MGIDDVVLSSEGHARVNERITKATRLCEEIQREVAGASEEEIQEAEGAIIGLLSKTLLQTGGIVNTHMGRRNAIRRMVTTGSKGSFINISQIRRWPTEPRRSAHHGREGQPHAPPASHATIRCRRREARA